MDKARKSLAHLAVVKAKQCSLNEEKTLVGGLKLLPSSSKGLSGLVTNLAPSLLAEQERSD